MNRKYRWFCYLLMGLILLSLGLLVPSASNAQEVVVDNDTPGTSYAGFWSESAGLDPWGANSLYGRDGARYTWHADLPATGVYEVYMWWTEYTSRSTAAPVTIQHVGGSDVVYVNQLENGGRWNLLGSYGFLAATGGTVTITAPDPYPTSYCADAVRFVHVPGANIPPVAAIASIIPKAAAVGEPVTFTGAGTDSDGTVVAYRWRSSIDGELSTAASFTRSDLSEGTHTIFLSVQDNDGDWSPEVTDILGVSSTVQALVVVDNDDPGTSYTGIWNTSAGLDPWGLNPYGKDSLWGRDGATFTWHADLPASGTYNVYMWWTDYISRSTRVPVLIGYDGGLQLVYVNQLENGGRWNLLGTWGFDAAAGGTITITAVNRYPTSYCADAVMFIYVAPSPPVPTDSTAAAVLVLLLAIVAKRHLYPNSRPRPDRC